MVFLIGIAAFISTSLGGLFALRLKDSLHLILGFSAGAVIGVAFFDLMPEALEIIERTHSAAFGTAIVATGFAIYLVLDRMITCCTAITIMIMKAMTTNMRKRIKNAPFGVQALFHFIVFSMDSESDSLFTYLHGYWPGNRSGSFNS